MITNHFEDKTKHCTNAKEFVKVCGSVLIVQGHIRE